MAANRTPFRERARLGAPSRHVQYTSDDIPDYFGYAKNYTVCDRYFSEVARPSTPNHLMLICADAPIINNPQHQYNPRPGQGYNLPLPAQLERAGLQWGNYGGYAVHYINELAGHRGNHTRNLAQVSTTEEGPPAKALQPPSAAIPILNKAIMQMETEDGWVGLGAVGHRLANIASHFDPRTPAASMRARSRRWR
jgi:hypothetical protein